MVAVLTVVRLVDVIHALDQARPLVLASLKAQLQWVESSVDELRQATARIDRTIFDIREADLRENLQRDLRRLDEAINAVADELARVHPREALDVLHGLRTDLLVQLRNPPIEPRDPQLPM